MCVSVWYNLTDSVVSVVVYRVGNKFVQTDSAYSHCSTITQCSVNRIKNLYYIYVEFKMIMGKYIGIYLVWQKGNNILNWQMDRLAWEYCGSSKQRESDKMWEQTDRIQKMLSYRLKKNSTKKNLLASTHDAFTVVSDTTSQHLYLHKL